MCHTGAKPQAESWYDTECTIIYSNVPTLSLITDLLYLKSLKYLKRIISFSKTCIIAQNSECTLRLHTQTLSKGYTDLTQPLTQDDTVQGRRMHSLCGY